MYWIKTQDVDKKKRGKKLRKKNREKIKKNYLRKNWRKNPYSFDWFLLLYSFKEERLFENTFWQHHMKFELILWSYYKLIVQKYSHIYPLTPKSTKLRSDISIFFFFCFLKGKKKSLPSSVFIQLSQFLDNPQKRECSIFNQKHTLT